MHKNAPESLPKGGLKKAGNALETVRKTVSWCVLTILGGGGNNCSLAAFHEAPAVDSTSRFSQLIPFLLLEMGRFGYCHSGHLYNNDRCFEPQCPDVFAFSILDSRPISSFSFSALPIRQEAACRRGADTVVTCCCDRWVAKCRSAHSRKRKNRIGTCRMKRFKGTRTRLSAWSGCEAGE